MFPQSDRQRAPGDRGGEQTRPTTSSERYPFPLCTDGTGAAVAQRVWNRCQRQWITGPVFDRMQLQHKGSCLTHIASSHTAAIEELRCRGGRYPMGQYFGSRPVIFKSILLMQHCFEQSASLDQIAKE